MPSPIRWHLGNRVGRPASSCHSRAREAQCQDGRRPRGTSEQAVATENRIRDGADAAMGYPRFGMLDLLKLLSGLLVGLFRSHAFVLSLAAVKRRAGRI